MYRGSFTNYSNQIIEGKNCIWLQFHGWNPAKPAEEFKAGEFMRWNNGHESKVLGVAKETPKTITFSIEWEKYGGGVEVGERSFKKQRWVAIGSGITYNIGAF